MKGDTNKTFIAKRKEMRIKHLLQKETGCHGNMHQLQSKRQKRVGEKSNEKASIVAPHVPQDTFISNTFNGRFTKQPISIHSSA